MTDTKITNATVTNTSDIKIKLASALNTISELQTPERYPQLSAQERFDLFNESMIYLCDTLGFNLDMYDHYVKGELSRDDYEDLTAGGVLIAEDIKEQLQEMYSLNGSMFSDDPSSTPTYTDGTPIATKDLAEMNMNALEAIASLLNYELKE